MSAIFWHFVIQTTRIAQEWFMVTTDLSRSSQGRFCPAKHSQLNRFQDASKVWADGSVWLSSYNSRLFLSRVAQ